MWVSHQILVHIYRIPFCRSLFSKVTLLFSSWKSEELPRTIHKKHSVSTNSMPTGREMPPRTSRLQDGWKVEVQIPHSVSISTTLRVRGEYRPSSLAAIMWGTEIQTLHLVSSWDYTGRDHSLCLGYNIVKKDFALLCCSFLGPLTIGSRF